VRRGDLDELSNRPTAQIPATDADPTGAYGFGESE
jgi:hypothetical protein